MSAEYPLRLKNTKDIRLQTWVPGRENARPDEPVFLRVPPEDILSVVRSNYTRFNDLVARLIRYAGLSWFSEPK